MIFFIVHLIMRRLNRGDYLRVTCFHYMPMGVSCQSQLAKMSGFPQQPKAPASGAFHIHMAQKVILL